MQRPVAVSAYKYLVFSAQQEELYMESPRVLAVLKFREEVLDAMMRVEN